MDRPVILGVVGDSAAGKTTICAGLVATLGAENVTYVAADDYHRYDRAERGALEITPLHPDCNHLDILAQDIGHLRDGGPILKPVYRHADGTLGRPEHVVPKRFAVVEGLLAYHTQELADLHDVRVFLAPPEELRRAWKLERDTGTRGYDAQQVLAELDRREPDAAAFIRPQRARADIVVSFRRGGDSAQLDAELTLCDSLPHPDLSPLARDEGEHAIRLVKERTGTWRLFIPGTLEPEHGAEIEELLWDRMQFAQRLRSERLGVFGVGERRRRSASLAIVQLLVLYQLVSAQAVAAVHGR